MKCRRSYSKFVAENDDNMRLSLLSQAADNVRLAVHEMVSFRFEGCSAKRTIWLILEVYCINSIAE